MLEFFRNLWKQTLEVVKNLPPGRLAAIGVVGIMTLAGILGVAYMAKKPDYQVLFSGLSPDDTTAITTRLNEQRIKYKLAQDGAAVMVPSGKALQLRLEMATAGLPSGGVVGYEIFDESTFGMTEFVQKLNYKRALQGELSRTINQFREIQSSRVHIAIPEKRLFSKDNQEPTASIVIKLAVGRRLAKGKVNGITHLVASSVEGLRPEKVTVVDVDGNVLAGGESSDEMAMLSSTQLEYKSNLEKALEKRITSMLENIVGPGKAVTRVSSEINFKQVERTEKTFDPNGQVVRSEQRAESKSTGEQAPIGVPGVQSNIPGTEQGAATTAKPASSANSQETTNYEINEVTSHVVEQVGTIKKLSVAVIVDVKRSAADKSGEAKFTPRNEQELKQIADLVKTAAGFDEKRGDKVVVESAPFDISKYEAQIEEAKADADRQMYGPIVQYVGMGALGLLLFVFIARPILRSLTAAGKDIETLRAFPQTVQQMEAKYGAGAEEGEKDFRTRARQVIESDPKVAAEMMRDWLRARR